MKEKYHHEELTKDTEGDHVKKIFRGLRVLRGRQVLLGVAGGYSSADGQAPSAFPLLGERAFRPQAMGLCLEGPTPSSLRSQ